MKKFSGFEAKKQAAREVLPAGGYVVKVLDVAEQHYTWGDVLEISFDVIEGAYAGFFAADYKNNPNEEKKWRGKFRLYEPKEDGSEMDGWKKKKFGGVIFAFEDSNPGFHWDWDETQLKGKTVGALFRDKEWEMNGNSGWTTECCTMITADDVRQNRFKMPKSKPLAEKAAPKTSGMDFEEILDDDELPFKL